MWYYYLYIGLIINTINIPYDNGANKLGSKNAPKVLNANLDFLDIDKEIYINTNDFLTNIINSGYNSVLSTLNENKFPLIIGGDHTIAISSIFAINEYCNLNNKSLGILWCDAHADFNTMKTSMTKNIHGMPISVLCGHTLRTLQISEILLLPDQFAYYGVRDIDSLEFLRMQEYNMEILENNNEIDRWIKKFDCIHISFDIDCLDPSVTNCVNTPVKNGKTTNELKKLFNKIKETNKLCGLDIVEYNPNNDSDHSIIIEIIKYLFL